MFPIWISIHLFALAVFHKNLQKLERLYAVSSLLVTFVVTAWCITEYIPLFQKGRFNSEAGCLTIRPLANRLGEDYNA